MRHMLRGIQVDGSLRWGQRLMLVQRVERGGCPRHVFGRLGRGVGSRLPDLYIGARFPGQVSAIVLLVILS